MRSSALFLSLLLACSDDAPRPIADAQGPPSATGAGSGGSGAVGAPGDPAPGVFYSVGDKLSPQLSWQGYTDGATELSVISLDAYHDPQGTRGINALLITEGQADCGPCIAEAKDLPKNLAGPWADLGIKVLQLIVADGKGAAATTETALYWKNKIHASWAVAADPQFTFAQIGSNPYPIQVLIDPRTLTIVDRIEGYRATLPELEALAAKNKK